MATSARIQSLLEQRRTYRTINPDRRRVLAPSRSTGVSNIARQNTKAELEIMIDRYNNGAIGNTEMLSFLESKQSDKYLTPSEKVDIQDKIADFNVRIKGDKLQAVYKSAPENSLEKVQAAQSLVSFYEERAKQMADGTPAQSQAISNAATWQSTVDSLKLNNSRKAQSNFMLQLRNNINTLPTSSSERSSAEADMWKQLYDMAVAQGDSESADKYANSYNQAVTMANQYAESESERAQREADSDQRTAVVQALQTLQNDYHDKRMDTGTYLQSLNEVSSVVDQIGDTSLALTVNRLIDSASKAQQGEMSAAVGREWDTSDKEYKSVVEELNKLLGSGQIDMSAYAEKMGEILTVRYEEIGGRLDQLTNRSDTDRVVYGGKSQTVAKVRELLGQEFDSSSGVGYGDKTEDGGLQQKIKDFSTGNVVAVVVPPDQFTTSGGTKKSGSAISTIRFVNKDNLPDNEYVPDDKGIYHRIEREILRPTPEQLELGKITGFFIDENGVSRKINYDAQTGAPYYFGDNQYVDAYNPGTSEKAERQMIKPGEGIKSFSSLSRPLVNQQQQAGDERIVSEQSPDQAVKAPLTLNLPAIEKVASEKIAKPALNLTNQTLKEISSKVESTGLPKIQTPKFEVPSYKNIATNLLPSAVSSLPVIGQATQGIQNVQKLAQLSPIKLPQPTLPNIQLPNLDDLKRGVQNIGTSIKNLLPFKLF